MVGIVCLLNQDVIANSYRRVSSKRKTLQTIYYNIIDVSEVCVNKLRLLTIQDQSCKISHELEVNFII